MNNIIFEKLIIIDKNNQKAKFQTFKKGINLISSNVEGVGNYKGKSTLVRSIYHTMGADADFDGAFGWEKEGPYYYLLEFLKNGDRYIFVRHGKYFQISDANNNIIFKTTNREDLSVFLSEFYDFKIYLKESSSKKYALSMPFAFYCLSFVDQKHYDGCAFTSFQNMGQYSNIYSDLILSHLGINNNELLEIMDKITNSENLIKEKEKSKEILNSMINKIEETSQLSNYADELFIIEEQLKLHKDEYDEIIRELSKLKNKLYEMYNLKSRLINYINELSCALKEPMNSKTVLNTHICPLCKTHIDNYTDVFFKKVRATDPINCQIIDSNEELEELERKIKLESKKYEEKMNSLKKLERVIIGENQSIRDTLKSLGIKEYKQKLIIEKSEIVKKIDEEIKSVNKNKKIKTKLMNQLDDINNKYSVILEKMIVKYNISNFNMNDECNIKAKFTCSDNHLLSTIIITAINRLKRIVAPELISFPLIMDNPTDRDFDSQNSGNVLSMIMDCVDDVEQILITKVDFDIEEYKGYKDVNHIKLTNEKYELLSENDYDKSIRFLNEILANSLNI